MEKIIQNVLGEAVAEYLTALLEVASDFIHSVTGITPRQVDAFLSFPPTGGGPTSNNPVPWEIIAPGRWKGQTETTKGLSERPAVLLSPHKVRDNATALMYMIPALLSAAIPPVQETKNAKGEPLKRPRTVEFPEAYKDTFGKLGFTGKPKAPVLTGTVATHGGETPRVLSEVIRDLAGKLPEYPAEAIEAMRAATASEVGRAYAIRCSTQVGVKFTGDNRGKEHISGNITRLYADKYKQVRHSESGVVVTFWPCPANFLADESAHCGGYVAMVPNKKQLEAEKAEEAKRAESALSTIEDREAATGTDGNVH